MNDNNINPSERRQHPRFIVNKDIYVATAPDYTRLGPAIDISRGGLSFYYIDQDFKSERSAKLCVAIPGTDIFLDHVQVETVYDVEISTSSSIGCIVMMRRGVRFDNLSEEHVTQLDDFIRNYTIQSEKC